MTAPTVPSLTPTQRSIVSMLADGKQRDEIAEEFGVTIRTVERRVEEAREKFLAKNRSHLVALCIRAGVIK